MAKRFIFIAALCLAPVAASAQDAAPTQRQVLGELAYVLGKSHALRQACAGPTDQFWRNRMQLLVRTEAPDAGLGHQLANAFNTGFLATRATFPNCGARSRHAEAAAAEEGRTLASTLARTVADDSQSR